MLEEDYKASFAKLSALAQRKAVTDLHGDGLGETGREYYDRRNRLANFLLRKKRSQSETTVNDKWTMVRTTAYYLWEQAGRPSGTAERDWERAEQIVKENGNGRRNGKG